MISIEPVPTPRTTNRRASPEAIEKRRAARAFNEVVLGPAPRVGDGRTERRRRRLLKELADGTSRGGHELKPIEVLLRAQALLELGEPLAAVLAARPPPAPVETTPALVEGLRNLHAAYGFAPDVYRLVGVDTAALELAGVHTRRGPVKAAPRPPAGGVRRGAA
jgi:hypothetical protein